MQWGIVMVRWGAIKIIFGAILCAMRETLTFVRRTDMEAKACTEAGKGKTG
jgi:hypothetical protein